MWWRYKRRPITNKDFTLSKNQRIQRKRIRYFHKMLLNTLLTKYRWLITNFPQILHSYPVITLLLQLRIPNCTCVPTLIYIYIYHLFAGPHGEYINSYYTPPLLVPSLSIIPNTTYILVRKYILKVQMTISWSVVI